MNITEKLLLAIDLYTKDGKRPKKLMCSSLTYWCLVHVMKRGEIPFIASYDGSGYHILTICGVSIQRVSCVDPEGMNLFYEPQSTDSYLRADPR